MKKLFVSSLALGITFGAASFASAAISGSAHDFSGDTWNGTGEICIPCHTPHNAQGDYTVAGPLWNHDLSTATYTLYSSPTFDGTATITQPAASSKACLSCHDGTVALGAFPQGGGGSPITGTAALGTDLSNDHPISFDYDAAQTLDSEIYVSSTAVTIGGSATTISAGMLFSAQLQCASCHDVHNKYSLSNLLKIDNSGSALCLTCHIK